MIGRDERASRAWQFDPHHLNVPFVINVIEMQDGEKSRICPSSLQMSAQVNALEALREQRRRQPLGPFVEIAEYQFGTVHASIVNDRRETLSLMTALQNGSAQMDVVKVQRLISNRDVNSLAAARFTGAPRQVVLEMLTNRQPRQDDVAELMTAKLTCGRHDPAHAERCANFFRVRDAARTRSHDLLQGDEICVNCSEDVNRAAGSRSSVEAAAAVNVVGGDAK